MLSCRKRGVVVASVLALPATAPMVAQDGGSTAAALAGGAFGVYSGVLLGNVGSIVPCTQTYLGATCVGISAGIGGAIGLSGGVLMGAADSERVVQSAKGAAFGALAGAAAGLALIPLTQRVEWRDVVTISAVGGAVGAAPRGAVIGLAAGTVVGGALWLTVPGINLPDFLGFAAGGMALGGLTQWLADGIGAHSGSESGAALVIPFAVTF